jgi:hypothetical protein
MSEANAPQDAESSGYVLFGLALVMSVVAFYVVFDYGTGPLAAQQVGWERAFYGLVGVVLLAYAGASFTDRLPV